MPSNLKSLTTDKMNNLWSIALFSHNDDRVSGKQQSFTSTDLINATTNNLMPFCLDDVSEMHSTLKFQIQFIQMFIFIHLTHFTFHFTS